MTTQQKLAGILAIWSCSTFIATPLGLAFHEGAPPCKVGDHGYTAVLLSDGGKVFQFLSSEDPPRSETILCNLEPGQIVKVTSSQKEM